MALVLDHINGVGDDNRIENLRIVCPNCAATLATHCGRNNPRRASPASPCAGCSRRSSSGTYCSEPCSLLLARRVAARAPKSASRKVERPTYAQLQADQATMSMLAIGRKYGVSDNAVRKWLRAYEREQAGEGGAMS